MAVVVPPALRQALRWGTGAGVVVDGNDLEVVVAHVLPNRLKLAATTRIANFAERLATEWGAELTRFLAANGARHVAALVVLPGERVLSRTVALAGVGDADATRALSFQLDGQHPWEPDAVEIDAQRIGTSTHFYAAIAERELIDRLATSFTEAGLRLAGFTTPASVLYHARRLSVAPIAPSVVAVRGLHAQEDAASFDVYAETAAYPLRVAQLPAPMERALALASSELRLENELEAFADWSDLVPRCDVAGDGIELSDGARSRLAVAWAAALVAACSHLGAPVNLLPVALRVQSSRAAWIPTIVLAAGLAGACAALAMQPVWLDRGYLGALRQHAHQLEPTARRVDQLTKHTAEAAERIHELDAYRKHTREDLDVMLELTKLLPPPATLSSINVTRQDVQIVGETPQAEGLLKKFDESPLFESTEFSSQIARNGDKDSFRLRTLREREKAPVVAAPAAPAKGGKP